jgi:hypothetical protein
MIDRIILFWFFLVPVSAVSQTPSFSAPFKTATAKYLGIYSYGDDVEKGKTGTVFIYPETDSTILFYIDLNRGAPSYNMGSD